MLSPSHIAPKEAGPAPRYTPSERASRARLLPAASRRRERRPPPPPAASPQRTHCGSGRPPPPAPAEPPAGKLSPPGPGGQGAGPAPAAPGAGSPLQPLVYRRGGEIRAKFLFFAGRPRLQAARGPGCRRAPGGDGGTSPHNAQVAGLAPRRRGTARSGTAPRRRARVPPLPSHRGRRDGRCDAVTLLAPVPLPRRSALPRRSRRLPFPGSAGASATAPGAAPRRPLRWGRPSTAEPGAGATRRYSGLRGAKQLPSAATSQRAGGAAPSAAATRPSGLARGGAAPGLPASSCWRASPRRPQLRPP